MSNLDLLPQKAIKAALKGDWEQAIALNKEIPNLEENNINALNRLAKAYIESKQSAEAKRILNIVLKLEPTNEIAKKNLRRVDKSPHTEGITPLEFFTKEPGKTKAVVERN